MIQIEDNDIPIIAAQRIIHGTKAVETTPAMRLGAALTFGPVPEIGEKLEAYMYSDAEIREIADYLMTYCKYYGEEA